MNAPDGGRWRVRRRLAPRLGAESLWGRFRRRVARTFRRTGSVVDADPGCLDVFGEGVVVVLTVVVVVLVALFVVLPLLVAVFDLALVLLVAVAGVVARFVFRRPWTVEAVADDGTSYAWRVVGWRASGEQVARVAECIAAGVPPPGPGGEASEPRRPA